MSGGKRIGLGYKQLGLKKENAAGALRLVQRSHETGEIFALRESVEEFKQLAKSELPPSVESEATDMHTLRLMLFRDGVESEMAHVEYFPLRKSIYVRHIGTDEAHRRRDMASSLLSYLKTHGKDIWLYPFTKQRPFYKKLGFAESQRYAGWELPAWKPLALRAWETRKRKFLITGKKK